MLRFAVTFAALALFAVPAAAQNFGFGWIEREGVETKEGPHGPPFKRAKVEGGFFGVPAAKTLSGPVTILPFEPALPAATLPLQKLGKYEKQECDGKFSKYRNVEFPDLPGDAYLQYVQPDKLRGAAFAGRALFVHPAQPGARTLPKQSVAPGDMPKGFALATLEAAFDLSGSGKAEVVRVDYCCYNPAFDEAQCLKAGGKNGGSKCFALYHKNKAGWRRVFLDRDQDC
jgi:hypothetical protein